MVYIGLVNIKPEASHRERLIMSVSDTKDNARYRREKEKQTRNGALKKKGEVTAGG